MNIFKINLWRKKSVNPYHPEFNRAELLFSQFSKTLTSHRSETSAWNQIKFHIETYIDVKNQHTKFHQDLCQVGVDPWMICRGLTPRDTAAKKVNPGDTFIRVLRIFFVMHWQIFFLCRFELFWKYRILVFPDFRDKCCWTLHLIWNSST